MQNIKIPKTCRYDELHSDTATKLLVVLHGYGQLPKFFIRKFQAITDEYHVVAPEGMHRFYLKGASGRVGASWMTKEARENDIANNHTFLVTLFEKLMQEKNYEEIVLLGFSQGAATSSRFFYATHLPIDRLINWASVFPPDIDITTTVLPKSNGNNHFVLGTEDEYFSEEQQKKAVQFYTSIGFQTTTFKGSHDIDKLTLETVLTK